MGIYEMRLGNLTQEFPLHDLLMSFKVLVNVRMNIQNGDCSDPITALGKIDN